MRAADAAGMGMGWAPRGGACLPLCPAAGGVGVRSAPPPVAGGMGRGVRTYGGDVCGRGRGGRLRGRPARGPGPVAVGPGRTDGVQGMRPAPCGAVLAADRAAVLRLAWRTARRSLAGSPPGFRPGGPSTDSALDRAPPASRDYGRPAAGLIRLRRSYIAAPPADRSKVHRTPAQGRTQAQPFTARLRPLQLSTPPAAETHGCLAALGGPLGGAWPEARRASGPRAERQLSP